MATATASKPKAARTIVSTKVTADGVKTVLSKSATDTIDRMMDLCTALKNIDRLQPFASDVSEALDKLKGAV